MYPRRMSWAPSPSHWGEEMSKVNAAPQVMPHPQCSGSWLARVQLIIVLLITVGRAAALRQRIELYRTNALLDANPLRRLNNVMVQTLKFPLSMSFSTRTICYLARESTEPFKCGPTVCSTMAWCNWAAQARTQQCALTLGAQWCGPQRTPSQEWT